MGRGNHTAGVMGWGLIIKGGVEIKEDANVQFLGKLEILELGDEEKMKKT